MNRKAVHFERASETLRGGLVYAKEAQDEEAIRAIEGAIQEVEQMEIGFEPMPHSPPLLLPNAAILDNPVKSPEEIFCGAGFATSPSTVGVTANRHTAAPSLCVGEKLKIDFWALLDILLSI